MSKKTVICIILLILLSLFAFSATLSAKEIKKMAVFPFKVNSTEDLSFMQKGIMDMLSSRLTRLGGLKVIDRATIMRLTQSAEGALDISKAASLAGRSNADYAVIGSITKFGEHISLDGEVIDVPRAKSIHQLFAEAPNMDAVIPQVGRIAQDIRNHTVGTAPQSAAAQAPVAPPAQSAAMVPASPAFAPPPGGYPLPPGGFDSSKEFDIFTRGGDETDTTEGQRYNPAFIMSRQADRAGRGYEKLPELDTGIPTALDIGDTDGDGMNETVIADDRRIYIYKNLLMDTTTRVAVEIGTVDTRILSVDVADMNRNGAAEIYVTAIRDVGEKMTSRVIEFRDGAYQVIAEPPYFFRVTSSLREGIVLYGQEKRVRAVSTSVFTEGMLPLFSNPFKLKWENDTLNKYDELDIKEDFCLMGFATIDLDHDGVEEYLFFDKKDRLKLYNAQGGLVWASDSPYGRTAKYYLKDFGREFSPNDVEPDAKVFLPPKIVTVDLDRDGFQEVVLCSNYEPLLFFSQTRIFSKSAILSLSWDGVDLMENWRTREMKGYVADFQIKDINNDGDPEMLVELIHKRGAKDYIKTSWTMVSFDLNVHQERKSSKFETGEASLFKKE